MVNGKYLLVKMNLSAKLDVCSNKNILKRLFPANCQSAKQTNGSSLTLTDDENVMPQAEQRGLTEVLHSGFRKPCATDIMSRTS